MPTLAELRGLWRRSVIQRLNTVDDTTQVYWLQSHAAFIDLRQPSPARDFQHVYALSDLSLEDCAWLAQQEGFAGVLSTDGAFFEWSRQIDFQPASAFADVGSLHWDSSTLVERGRYQAYVEHWHRAMLPLTEEDASEEDFQLTLRKSENGVPGALVRVGAYFMLARARSVQLPSAASLVECVAAATLAEARAILDCEISFGRVRGDVYRIIHSTLPYRVATQIQMTHGGPGLVLREQTRDGTAQPVNWDIVERNGSPEHPC